MKFIAVLTLCLLVLSSCNVDKMNQEVRQDFKENHYNFKLAEEMRYATISFKLPEKFTKSYNKYYTIKGNALVRESYALGIKFSVEHYTRKDFKKYFIRESGFHVNELNTLHDAYTERRMASLDNSGSSFKKTLSKKKSYKGIIQVLSGEDDYNDDLIYYATATIKMKDDYYVFQWISTPEMMSYTLDDFERIIYSVKKTK